ncbi:hypothetical protein PDM83_27560, partial [Bacillus cereus]|nr:hypothetical protein [Bacillus cereus]MDA2107190.1 hypothetical protein [Bacillus cereus]
MASLLPERQKAPLRQKLHPPSQSERAACAFHCPSPAAKTVGHFTPSLEAKGASSSGVPMPSCSERAACAFHCPSPAAKTVGHFTPSLEAKGASSSGVPM